MTRIILGISAFYHDSAAALVVGGDIIAAAHEERFTRIKHDERFPVNAVKYVLDEGGYNIEDVTEVVFYDKPLLKFERLLETYHEMAPRGIVSFLSSMPVWVKDKLFMKSTIRKELGLTSSKKIPIRFSEHHLSHAASAFFPSPFESAAILTIDGVGEWATTTIGFGSDNRISIVKELNFPHSLGLLYSAFTYFCGFKVNSGEYKLMGLAPYGCPRDTQTRNFKKIIEAELVDIRDDGSILLNMEYFKFASELRMIDDTKWTKLFGIPPRSSDEHITQDYMNIALAIQQVTEDIVLKLALHAKALTQSTNLVLAGGVALNCVANGKLLESGIFDQIWIQPAAGDAGGALGAALLGWFLHDSSPQRKPLPFSDSMRGAYLGPEYSSADILKVCRKYSAKYTKFSDFEELSEHVASLIANGKIVGWHQGRMEFGPRALGNRNILADARNPEMQKRLNLKTKFREGFRPFAPSVLEEDCREYFDLKCSSPYMLLVAPVQKMRTIEYPETFRNSEMFSRLYFVRSDIPAVTHVDYSARIQTVSQKTNPRYWSLIKNFKKITGHAVIVNTSFNVRGEPIVCSPDDSFRCFMRSDIDFLVIGDYFFDKAEQPDFNEKNDWKETFKLD